MNFSKNLVFVLSTVLTISCTLKHRNNIPTSAKPIPKAPETLKDEPKGPEATPAKAPIFAVARVNFSEDLVTALSSDYDLNFSLHTNCAMLMQQEDRQFVFLIKSDRCEYNQDIIKPDEIKEGEILARLSVGDPDSLRFQKIYLNDTSNSFGYFRQDMGVYELKELCTGKSDLILDGTHGCAFAFGENGIWVEMYH